MPKIATPAAVVALIPLTVEGWCHLTPEQATAYEHGVAALAVAKLLRAGVYSDAENYRKAGELLAEYHEKAVTAGASPELIKAYLDALREREDAR